MIRARSAGRDQEQVALANAVGSLGAGEREAKRQYAATMQSFRGARYGYIAGLLFWLVLIAAAIIW